MKLKMKVIMKAKKVKRVIVKVMISQKIQKSLKQKKFMKILMKNQLEVMIVLRMMMIILN